MTEDTYQQTNQQLRSHLPSLLMLKIRWWRHKLRGVRIGRGNGDDSVRQSIEAAVYRASPLPQPSDPALFERILVINFEPRN